MFKNGERQQEYSTKYLLPLSGRLIPEFDKRRSIKDMFTPKPTGSQQKPASYAVEQSSMTEEPSTPPKGAASNTLTNPPVPTESQKAAAGVTRKRSEKSAPTPPTPVKRSKSTAQDPGTSAAGQQTLKGFFKPKSDGNAPLKQSPTKNAEVALLPEQESESRSKISALREPSLAGDGRPGPAEQSISADEASQLAAATPAAPQESETVIDPVASKEDWSKLFSRRPPPKCESHQEHCVSLTTKKPGINCGRAFWICPRPLGPSGNKEKGTQWRCATFIWASDWNPST